MSTSFYFLLHLFCFHFHIPLSGTKLNVTWPGSALLVSANEMK